MSEDRDPGQCLQCPRRVSQECAPTGCRCPPCSPPKQHPRKPVRLVSGRELNSHSLDNTCVVIAAAPHAFRRWEECLKTNLCLQVHLRDILYSLTKDPASSFTAKRGGRVKPRASHPPGTGPHSSPQGPFGPLASPLLAGSGPMPCAPGVPCLHPEPTLRLARLGSSAES